MKILFISAFPPARGSLAEYSDYLINDLKKHSKIKNITILANKTDNSKEKERLGKVNIVRCWESNSCLIPFQIMKEVFVRNRDVDIIHFNLNMMNWGTGKIANLLGYMTPLILKSIFRKKTIVTLHNIADAIDLNKVQFLKPSFLNRLGLKLITIMLLKVDMVTVTIRRYKKLLENNYGASNAKYVPHGFPTPIRRIKPNNDKSVLLFGFLDPRKKIDFLVKIFEKMKLKDEKLKLVIAGSSHPKFPNYLGEIKRKFNGPEIVFTGYVPQHKVKDLFLSATLVVLPYSVSVGSSGVLHLAASYGKPVVSTDLKDIVGIVNDENLLIETAKLKDFNKSMEKVLYSRRLQKKMIEHNLKSAEKLSFKVISKMFIDLYKEVLGVK